MNNLQHDIKFILDLIKKKNFLEVKSRLDKRFSIFLLYDKKEAIVINSEEKNATCELKSHKLF